MLAQTVRIYIKLLLFIRINPLPLTQLPSSAVKENIFKF